jgi:hypothetical protein
MIRDERLGKDKEGHVYDVIMDSLGATEENLKNGL